MEDVLVVGIIFSAVTLAILAISPVGRALADRIRGRLAASPAPHQSSDIAELREELTGELEAMRQEMGEFAERLDFTERIVAKQKDAERLGPGRLGPGSVK